MQQRLTVLVTGASSGIGASAAKMFNDRGFHVVGTSRSPENVADPTPGVEYLPLDQTDPASIAALVEAVGEVDILVNNAGESQTGALEEVPMADIERLFATNVFGPIALTKAVLPGMRERGRGSIVMVGSMAGSFPTPYRSVYSAAKSALRTFADSLRGEVAQFGVAVTTVEPGVIATGIETRRARISDDTSPYRVGFESVDKAMARRERSGLATDKLAELVVEAALSANPKPLYARGTNAPFVFTLARLVPRRMLLDTIARTHGIGRTRPDLSGR